MRKKFDFFASTKMHAAIVVRLMLKSIRDMQTQKLTTL